MKFESIAIF